MILGDVENKSTKEQDLTMVTTDPHQSTVEMDVISERIDNEGGSPIVLSETVGQGGIAFGFG